MKKVLFPLYAQEDEKDFAFYRNAFEKEGFYFALAQEEGLLLRADAVLAMGNESLRDDGAQNAFLDTALARNIPVVLVHADRMPSLKDVPGVIGADRVTFAQLREMIQSAQSDIYRRPEPETKSSRFVSVLCFCLIAMLAALILFKAVDYTMHDKPQEAVSEVIGDSVKQAVVRVYSIGSMNEEAWRGCGFAVNDDGYIITNAHVVDHYAVRYYVTYRNNRYEAEVIHISEKDDIALVHINTPTRFNLAIAKNLPAEDETVYAVGWPGDQKLSILSGSVAGENIRFSEEISYVPLHMALKAGISGSPVVDEDGNVAGIASAVSSADENLSYMVSCENVRDFLKDYLFVEH